MHTPKVTPYVPKDLLKYLEETFPLYGYLSCNSENDLHRTHGRQDVISHLRQLSEVQSRNGNILNVSS